MPRVTVEILKDNAQKLIEEKIKDAEREAIQLDLIGKARTRKAAELQPVID